MNKKKLSQEFWKTETGQATARLMHEGGWETMDAVYGLRKQLHNLAEQVQDQSDRQKLLDAENSIAKTYEILRNAIDGLKDGGF